MAEIYWLQRLGNMAFVFNVGFWLCVIVALVISVVSFLLYLDDDIGTEELKRFKWWLKKYAMVFAFFTAGALVTPTTDDLLAIYGIGGTIDYIKSNDKAKELPDKVVDALTKYIDTVVNKDKEK